MFVVYAYKSHFDNMLIFDINELLYFIAFVVFLWCFIMIYFWDLHYRQLNIDKDLSGGFLIEYLSVGLEFPRSLHDKLNKDHVLLYCNIFKTRIDKFNDERQFVDYMRILSLIYQLYNKLIHRLILNLFIVSLNLI